MSNLDMELSAVDAARVIGVSAKTIYNWIEDGRLPARRVHRIGKPWTHAIHLVDLAALPDVRIDPERLKELAVPEMAQRTERWQRRVDELLAAANERITELERQVRYLLEAPERARQEQLAAPPPSSPAQPSATRAPVVSGPLFSDVQRFRNWQERAVFLALHGWAMSVTKLWHDECPMGPPEAVLRYALERDKTIGWRATVRNRRVRECEVDACPCHQLFASLTTDEQ
jgi:excisionase family DNA binding protein